MSDETKLELIKKRYLDDLPEWKVEIKRITEQKKLEFESEVNAHHDGDDGNTE